ncbi:MAG: FAD-dependent oxidoreductase, partial [Chlamydiales bacterium]
MKVAVIGAGLSGLATCYYLLELGYAVHLFDEKGVGGAASGIACGLLHPYPGEEGKRSWRADEALR